jgi:cardiolipin synthase A/B
MTPTKPRRPRKPLVVIATVIVTLLLAVLARNFVGGEGGVQRRIPRLYSVHDSAFARAMGLALGPSIVGGNKVVALLNGDEIFPAMLQVIRGAQKTITLETYIYWAGEIGEQFALALSERARAGIKVHVLVDWVGSEKIDASYEAMMKKAGVEFRKYRPLRWYNLGRVNNRTHRKLLVVDGRIAFTGGVGIADVWTGHAQDTTHWRDSHYEVEGPAVAEMQAAFMDNWITATGNVLHGDDYFPPLAPVGSVAAQVFSSSPDGGSTSMELMYLLAITAAQRSIYLSSSYFVPDPLTQQALADALKRGVKVQIVVPGKHIDSRVVRHASRSRWGDILAAGGEIFEYEPTMYHCKVFIVDELLVSVGSTNWDPRSFGLNDETNLNIYDADFARQQVEVFRQDLIQSHQVTLAEWQARPWREKFMERLASVFGSVL